MINRYGREGERRRRPGNRDLSARPGAPGRRYSPDDTGQRARHSQPTCPRRNLSQELGPRQAGITQPALRVQDSQFRRTARRPKPIPRHADLGPLAHHVAAQSNPGSPPQLQPQRRDLGKGARQGGGKARWLQDEQLDAGSTSQGSQSAETLGQVRRRNPGSRQGSGRQVQQQQVHGPILEKHGRHRQRLLERIGRQDDQPLELNAPGNGLHRIQASGQIQIRRDPAGSLGPGHGLQRERRLAAGPIAVEDRGCGARQPAQPKDRVQGAKAGGYRPIRRGRQAARQHLRVHVRTRSRSHRQRPHHFDSPRWVSCAPARSCPAPAFLERRQSGLNVRGRGRHGIDNDRTRVLSVKAPTRPPPLFTGALTYRPAAPPQQPRALGSSHSGTYANPGSTGPDSAARRVIQPAGRVHPTAYSTLR